MRFEIGSEVVCIKNCNWDYGFGPKKGEVVTVTNFGYFRFHPQDGEPLKNKFWLAFSEYPQVYNGRRNAYAAKYFRPIAANITELTEILEQQPEHA